MASVQIASADKKLVSFVKSLLEARDTLLQEMQRLSKAVGQTIDLSEFVSTMDNTLLPESAEDEEGSGQGKQQNNLEVLGFILQQSVYFYLLFCFTIFWNMSLFLHFFDAEIE